MWGSGSQLKAEIATHWGLDQPDNKHSGVDGVAHCVSLWKYVTKKGQSYGTSIARRRRVTLFVRSLQVKVLFNQESSTE